MGLSVELTPLVNYDGVVLSRHHAVFVKIERRA
ncbi:hypothetical protein Tfer_0149 [Thermincola ferriacetica]|uniref:Uncharacterized protein n=1 Tax=Thermincola ferriacetica TaxID=281456 RepID=A0A0L6W7J3_9FIRM|nr:hypothetical protein Tfer_0149 [Thermincola ferriacetica]